MVEKVVINTGPLIALERINALALVQELPYEFLCPAEVRAELDAGASRGYPPVTAAWLRVVPSPVVSPLVLSTLDSGEAAVIQVALDMGIQRVCIDEWKGGSSAESVGDLRLREIAKCLI
jgi:predicted nucleic acid-binding protein